MTKVNRNYCKPDAEMKPVYAPAVFRYNGVDYWHPEKEDFALVGYLPLSPDWPVDPPEGKHYERTDKIERDGDGYKWVYIIVDNPPPTPLTFDKYLLVDALMKAGAWERVKAWLQSQPDAYDRAVMAPDVSEDEQLLADGIDAAKEAFGWTDADVEELLSKCAKEG